MFTSITNSTIRYVNSNSSWSFSSNCVCLIISPVTCTWIVMNCITTILSTNKSKCLFSNFYTITNIKIVSTNINYQFTSSRFKRSCRTSYCWRIVTLNRRLTNINFNSTVLSSDTTCLCRHKEVSWSIWRYSYINFKCIICLIRNLHPSSRWRICRTWILMICCITI